MSETAKGGANSAARRRNWLVFAFALALLGAAGIGTAHYLIQNGSSVTSVRRMTPSETPIAKKTVNMQGAWRGEDKLESFLTETLKEFQARNPGIAISLKWNGDFPTGREGAIDATIEQFKTGKIAWDIIWLEPFYYQEIGSALKDQDWAKRYLVDFETVPGFAETQKSFILSDPQFRNHMNGVITGPYVQGFYQPLFYNKDVADAMGIKVKEEGMTFDDLLGYFGQVDAYNREHGTQIAALYDSGDYKGGIGYAQSVWNVFQSLFRSEFPSVSEMEDTVHSPAKMAATKKVLRSLEQLSKHKPLIQNWKNLNWFDTRAYALDGKALFTACGASWMYSHWHGIDVAKTAKMMPAEMPVYQKVGHYMGGYNPVFAVAKDSPVREEAIRTLMAFTTPNSAEKWVRYSKSPSGVNGGISMAGGKVSRSANQFDIFAAYITEKYGGNVFDSKTVDYVLGKKYKDLTLKFTMHLGEVMDGKETAEEAYAAILSDMRAVDDGR